MATSTRSCEDLRGDRTEPLEPYTSEATVHYTRGTDKLAPGNEFEETSFNLLPERINSSTSEFVKSLFTEEIEDDRAIREWWTTNIHFHIIHEHDSYSQVCLNARRRLITSTVWAVYFLSLLVDKAHSQGLPAHCIKFVASTASKSIVRNYHKCELALLSTQDVFLLKEIQTMKNLLVLSLSSCFGILAVVNESDCKENRKVNASICGQILIKEISCEETSEEIKIRIINVFESVLQTSILTKTPWRSGTKGVLQELAQACIEMSMNESTSDYLVERVHSLLVLLSWKSIKALIQTNKDIETTQTAFEWLMTFALDEIETNSKRVCIVCLEGASDETIEIHVLRLKRLLALLFVLLEKGNRDSDSNNYSTDYLAGPIIPMDRLFQALEDLAKCVNNVLILDMNTHPTGLLSKPLFSSEDVKEVCRLTLQLMKIVVSRMESSRASMCGQHVAGFLERLILLPRDPAMVIKLILYDGEYLADLFQTLSVRCPSILLREASSEDLSSTRSAVFVSPSVRTKVSLAGKIVEEIFRLLEMFKNSIIDTENTTGDNVLDKLITSDRFDSRLIANKNKCIMSQSIVLRCMQILSHLLRITKIPHTLENDITRHIVWWLLTGLDSLLQTVHLRLTLKGLNSVTATLLSLRQKNGQILSTMEMINLITYILFDKNAAVYKALLTIIRSLLDLDESVSSVLQNQRLKVSPILEAICTLIKLWNDVLRSDTFKLCVDEDALLLNATLMNQIWLRLVTGGNPDEYRLDELQLELGSRVWENELNVERSTVDSPLLREDEGLYLYQYNNKAQTNHEHMTDDGDLTVSKNDPKSDISTTGGQWKSPKECIPFSHDDCDLSFDENLDDASDISEESSDHEESISASADEIEDMGVSASDNEDKECSGQYSRDSDSMDDEEDEMPNIDDYFVSNESHNIMTIVDDEDHDETTQKDYASGNSGNLVNGDDSPANVKEIENIGESNARDVSELPAQKLVFPNESSLHFKAEEIQHANTTISLVSSENVERHGSQLDDMCDEKETV